MMRRVLVAGLMSFGLAATVSSGQMSPAIVSYDEFERLDDARRLATFAGITASNRALLMQTHLARWRAANRQRLTGYQLAVIDDAIEVFSTRAYEFPPDPVLVKRQRILAARAACVFKERDRMRAFSMLADDGHGIFAARSWLESAAAMMDRLSSCAQGYILSQR